MRTLKTLALLTALAMSGTAFAAAGPASQTVQIDNGIVDTIAVTGAVTVNITALNTAVTNTAATLAYSTHSDHTTSATHTRKVTVSSTALPTGLTGTVAFAPATGKGTAATAAVALGVSVSLVTAIPQYITQDAVTLTYSFTASKGFTAAPVTVTYTLADE